LARITNVEFFGYLSAWALLNIHLSILTYYFMRPAQSVIDTDNPAQVPASCIGEYAHDKNSPVVE
jgi:hypothetical protein